jgi:hypothetical protein
MGNVRLPFRRLDSNPNPMNLKLLQRTAAVALALCTAWTQAGAQCTNSSQYPGGTITPDGLGAVTTISTCSFQQEYSHVGPIIDGATYQFTCTSGSYITVHQDTYDGPVIGSGYSPLNVTAVGTGDLFAHWNVDSTCATGSNCETTTVQLFLDCTPPSATVTPVDDCDNNQFSLTVDVTSLGDGTDVDLIYSVNGGADQTLADQPVGSYVIGPFTVGDVVDLTVAHSSDALCNLHFPGLQSANTCPTIIECGGAPLDQTYCYINNDNNHWHYQSSSGMPLIIIFSSGTVESATYDHLTIYDGPDNQSPVLYDHVGNTEDLTGLQVVAPSGEMYMENSSDGSVSCATNTDWTWNWQVGCLDCTPATATFSVVTDCDNYEYSVQVHLTDVGSDGTLDIAADSLSNVLLTVTDTGLYTVGPFTANVPVSIILSNSDNSLCNVNSGLLVNPLCPLVIDCGAPAVQENYCYTVNDTMAWHWQAATPGDSLSLRFNSGTIQGAFSFGGDHLAIYDGPDNNSPILFQHTLTSDLDLAGLQVTSTQPDIYMEMTSDGFGACSDGSTTPWDWVVGCADCAPPEATYNVVTDCDNYEFSVEVHITNLGSDGTLDITADSLGTVLATATDTGFYTVGPFTANIPVVITLVNSENDLCSRNSGQLVNPLCPTTVECGGAPLDETYCYTNNDNHAWHWQSSSGLPLIMIFSSGMLEANFYDNLIIYDGPDASSPILYQNGTNTTDLTGLQVIAPSGHIYMTATSDGIISCETNNAWTWNWQVGCLDCTMPTVTYNVVTDCDAMTYNVEVNITEMGSDPVLDITNDGGALPVAAPGVGTYTVGPFTAGDTTVITLVNDMNPLCNVNSGPLVNPLCPTVIACGGATLQETYCYINNDHHEWHWQSSGGQPLALQFSSGTVENSIWDHLTIYDGPDANSDTLYNHDGETEDLTGLLVISTGPDIYMTNSSDGVVSCSSDTTWTWNWEVGCLDCTNPAASFTMVEDCIHHAFSIAVNVDSTGSSPVVRIANSLGTDTLTNVPAGTTLVGPFPMDSTVTLTVLNETNNLCRIFSPAFTSASVNCVDSVCAATAYNYCYSNTDTAWFAYQGTATVPITIGFLQGQLLPGDFVQIYDGLAPNPGILLWQGNLNGNMAGFAINTTNPQHQMLMRVVSNSSGSCATGEASPELQWVVQCGAVGINETAASSFAMFPNPTTGELSLRLPADAHGEVEMRVVDLTGRTVHQERFTAAGGTNTFELGNLQSGNYMVTITTTDWVKSERLQIIR